MYESSYGGTSGKVVAVDASQAVSTRAAAAFLTDHVTERCTAEDSMEDVHWEDVWQMAQALTGGLNLEGQRKLADARQRRQEALHMPTVHDVEDLAVEGTGSAPSLPFVKMEVEAEEQVNTNMVLEKDDDEEEEEDDGVNEKSKKEAKKRKKEEKKAKKEAKRARKEVKKKKKSSDA